jgi:hypothetical protein
VAKPQIDPAEVQELVNVGAPIDAKQLGALLGGMHYTTVLERVKARDWPSFKPGRKTLFTPEQVREIQAKTATPVVARRRRTA